MHCMLCWFRISLLEPTCGQSVVSLILPMVAKTDSEKGSEKRSKQHALLLKSISDAGQGSVVICPVSPYSSFCWSKLSPDHSYYRAYEAFMAGSGGGHRDCFTWLPLLVTNPHDLDGAGKTTLLEQWEKSRRAPTHLMVVVWALW